MKTLFTILLSGLFLFPLFSVATALKTFKPRESTRNQLTPNSDRPLGVRNFIENELAIQPLAHENTSALVASTRCNSQCVITALSFLPGSVVNALKQVIAEGPVGHVRDQLLLYAAQISSNVSLEALNAISNAIKLAATEGWPSEAINNLSKFILSLTDNVDIGESAKIREVIERCRA